MSRDDLAP